MSTKQVKEQELVWPVVLQLYGNSSLRHRKPGVLTRPPPSEATICLSFQANGGGLPPAWGCQGEQPLGPIVLQRPGGTGLSERMRLPRGRPSKEGLAQQMVPRGQKGSHWAPGVRSGGQPGGPAGLWRAACAKPGERRGEGRGELRSRKPLAREAP